MSHKNDIDPRPEVVPDTYGYSSKPSYGDNDVEGTKPITIFDLVNDLVPDLSDVDLSAFTASIAEAWNALGLSLTEIERKLKLAEMVFNYVLQDTADKFITVTEWRIINWELYINNLMAAYPDVFSLELPAGSEVSDHIRDKVLIIRRIFGSKIKVPKEVIIMGQTLTDDTPVVYEKEDKTVTMLDFFIDELFIWLIVFVIAKVTYISPSNIMYAMITGYKLIREDPAVTYMKEYIEPVLLEINNRLIGLARRIENVKNNVIDLAAHVGFKLRYL